jgi:hypothetical protein
MVAMSTPAAQSISGHDCGTKFAIDAAEQRQTMIKRLARFANERTISCEPPIRPGRRLDCGLIAFIRPGRC